MLQKQNQAEQAGLKVKLPKHTQQHIIVTYKKQSYVKQIRKLIRCTHICITLFTFLRQNTSSTHVKSWFHLLCNHRCVQIPWGVWYNNYFRVCCKNQLTNMGFAHSETIFLFDFKYFKLQSQILSFEQLLLLRAQNIIILVFILLSQFMLVLFLFFLLSMLLYIGTYYNTFAICP